MYPFTGFIEYIHYYPFYSGMAVYRLTYHPNETTLNFNAGKRIDHDGPCCSNSCVDGENALPFYRACHQKTWFTILHQDRGASPPKRKTCDILVDFWRSAIFCFVFFSPFSVFFNLCFPISMLLCFYAPPLFCSSAFSFSSFLPLLASLPLCSWSSLFLCFRSVPFLRFFLRFYFSRLNKLQDA